MGRGLPGAAPCGAPRWPATPAAALRCLEPGERLFRQGEPSSGLHWLDAGAIALRRVDGLGNEHLARLRLPGDSLGHRALVTARAHAATAEALTPCQVRSLDASSALCWLASSSEANAALMRQLAEDLEHAEALQLALARWPVSRRLCWILAWLAERLADGDALHLPLGRQDLASWIGARPETLARAIRQLRERGIARFSGRHVRLDRKALAAVAAGLDLDQEPAGTEPAS